MVMEVEMCEAVCILTTHLPNGLALKWFAMKFLPQIWGYVALDPPSCFSWVSSTVLP